MNEFKYTLINQFKFGSTWISIVDIAEILRPYFPVDLKEFTIKGESKDKDESLKVAIEKAKRHYLEFKNNVDQIK